MTPKPKNNPCSPNYTAQELRDYSLGRAKEAIDLMWVHIEAGDKDMLKHYTARVMPAMTLKDDRHNGILPPGPAVQRFNTLMLAFNDGKISLDQLIGLTSVVMKEAEATEIDEIRQRLDTLAQSSPR
jgi:hypothetical protein